MTTPTTLTVPLRVPGRRVRAVGLDRAESLGVAGVSTAPRTARILVENVLRQAVLAPGAPLDDALLTAGRVVAACAGRGPAPEIGLRMARIVMQDHTGLPVLADLATLRSLLHERGLDPELARPRVPVDLVVDHSVEVRAWGSADALRRNTEAELALNRERYRFLGWARQGIPGVRVVPPGRGIIHQIHLEHLAEVVRVDGGLAGPDTVLGTDSHTPMVNALGVLGWGVGGIEAALTMLGHPVTLLAPPVVGVRLTGALAAGVTATDLALTMTRFLRDLGVVGSFVEFFGPGVRALSVADRATVANMAPEYGSTVAWFPVDEATVEYLRLTGRPPEQVALVRAYAERQGLFASAEADEEELTFARTAAFDLGRVEPCVAGPRRPQDRVPLREVAGTFPGPGTRSPGGGAAPADGFVAIAAITSCTNTANPAGMVTAGLLARAAVARGLAVPPWVKTSLAPGSRVVTRHLDAAGLLAPLERLGFAVAGYGCTTCIGNSGALADPAAEAVRRGVRPAAVLSGNRNFDGRVHPEVPAVYLASPALVVAFALAGTVLTDLTGEPLGRDARGREVYLRDLWPSPEQIAEATACLTPEHFAAERTALAGRDLAWAGPDTPSGPVYDWPQDSTYLVRSPFFTLGTPGLADLRGARVLVHAGDFTTTDHISPAGAIPPGSAAARHLDARGVPHAEHSSYGCRRGNHEVLVRGAFSNPAFRNRLAPARPGGWTTHLPSGRELPVYEAAREYAAAGVPALVLAGREYGVGSSRDWAAKGPALLGVRAVLAEGFERIHRSNLVGMGIVPLRFEPGTGADTLGLTGREVYDVTGLRGLTPRGKVTVRAAGEGAPPREWHMTAHVETEREVRYLRDGGFLRSVAAELLPG
ncbi:aconitate hydratase AcnA [Streptomyces capparidis]